MSFTADELIKLSQVLGGAGALVLLLVLIALWRQLLWIGPSVMLLLAEKDKQIIERDRRIVALDEQVVKRDQQLDAALDLAGELKGVLEVAVHR